MIDWYKIGAYLDACKLDVGEEGFLHVLAEAGIEEGAAQAFLELKEACNADPAIMDWLEVSDRVPEPVPFNFASMLSPQIFETAPRGYLVPSG